MDSRITRQSLTQTVSQDLFPKTIGEMFDYADWMYTHFGTYTQALKNAVRYFLGDISVTPADTDKNMGPTERAETIEDLLTTYTIFSILGRVGDDYVQWGNSFTSIDLVRRRRFTCPSCKFIFPADTALDLSYSNGTFRVACPSCKYRGSMDHHEAIDGNAPLRVQFWNPRTVSIEYNPITKNKYYTIIPPDSWVKAFKEGGVRFFAETPIDALEALDMGRALEIANPAYFKHLATPSPATIEDTLGGWGLPLFLSEFETVIHLLMMRRYNEAILSDFVIPFRTLSPPSTGAVGTVSEPLETINLSDFKSQMQLMIGEHRDNPTSIKIAPYPVQYQIFGGEAKDLIPLEIKDAITDELLNAMCIPLEFKAMTMTQGGGPPTGLRRFEKVWAAHVAALDEWLQWFCDCRTNLLKVQAIKAKLVKSSIYEDDLSREYKVKLGMGDAISKETAFKPLGIDFREESIKMMDERSLMMQQEEKFAEEMKAADALKEGMGAPPAGTEQLYQYLDMQAMQAQGGMPQQGMPPQGGGMPPPQPGAPGGEDIESLWAQAEQMAEEIRTLPAEERRSQLINLKKTNVHLHAFVTQIFETIEQQAAREGVAASRQPQGM